MEQDYTQDRIRLESMVKQLCGKVIQIQKQ